MIKKLAWSAALLLAASFSSLPAIADSSGTVLVQTAQAQSELDYWNAIKDSKKAEDYQGYLDKYPNGNFADLAKLRVKKYTVAAPAPEPAPAAPAPDPQQQDIAYWNSIKSSKNADDYKAYLEKYPNGEFVDLAKLRVEQYAKPIGDPVSTPTVEPLPSSEQPAAVAPTPSPAPTLTFVAQSATLYATNGGQVRAEPDPKAALVTKLKTNTEVKATGLSTDGKWWRVEVGGQSGYMHRSVLSEQPVAVTQKKKSEPAAAPEPTGPDEEICKPTSSASGNGRVAACERLVAKAADDKAKIAALGDLAAALNQAKRRDEAIRKYEQAAVLAPRDPSIYTRIGLVRLDQRRFPEARAAFEKAAQLDNQDPDIVYYRSLSYIGVGDFEKAKLEVERALLVPNDPALYYEKLGEINIARGDLAAAKVALERGNAADSNRRSLTLAAVNYFTGNHDAAASQASASSAPTAPLWSALAKKAKGDAGGATAALESGKGAAGDAWPGPVYDTLSGATTLAKAKPAAKDRDANTGFEQLCALNFFAGEWAYLNGDKEAARSALQAALATRAYWTLEFAAAKARLANM
ncbi:SH3 domain-containing protein [Dongia sp.]|uniref:SH3 domain-containing protein n=1 Tax=Dongia sp. TaxID=1977262 RepID=UPI0037532F4A